MRTRGLLRHALRPHPLRFFAAVSITSVVFVLGLVLLVIHQVTDGAVDRVLGPASRVDGAFEG